MNIINVLKLNTLDVLNVIQYEESAIERAESCWGFLKTQEPQDPEQCMDAIKDCSFALQYIKKPTKEMCLEAVTKNGLSLQFVPKELKTLKVCMQAVSDNGFALKYVDEQTPEIIKEAITNAPCSLKYVKNQTLDICKEAVSNYSLAIKYAQFQDEDMCKQALSGRDVRLYSEIEYRLIAHRTGGYIYPNNGVLIQYVQNPTEELCKIAVSHFGTALRYIDPEFHTKDVCMTAIKNYLPAIKLVKNKSVEFWKKAFSYEPDAIKYIDWYSQTPEMVMEAVKASGGCLMFICEDLKTPELCRVAVEARPDMIASVPRKIQAQVYESLSDEGRVRIPEMYYKYCVFYLTSELEESLLKDPNETVRAKMAALGFK